MTAARQPGDDPAVRAVRRAVLAAIAQPGRPVAFRPAQRTVAEVVAEPDDASGGVVRVAAVPAEPVSSDQVVVVEASSVSDVEWVRLSQVPFLTLVVGPRSLIAVPPATEVVVGRLPSPP